MSPKERRIFALGYRMALRKARRELDAITTHLDNEIAELDAKMRAEYQQTARSIDAEIDGVRAEMRAARQEFHRYRVVEAAIATERDPNELLN